MSSEERRTEAEVKIFLAIANPSSLNEILHLLKDEINFEVVNSVLDGESCLKEIVSYQVDVLIAELGLPKISGIKVAEYLSLECPSISTIILADNGNLDFFRRAMRAGAREFLMFPLSKIELVSTINKVYQLTQKRQRKARSLLVEQPSKHSGFIKSGKLISIFSGKGGTGKSFVIANLAGQIRKFYPELNIALVDLDLQFGDLACLYNLQPKKTLIDLIPIINELSSAKLKSIACSLDSQMDLFVSSAHPELVELLSSQHLKKLLSAFRNGYDLIIANTAAFFREVHLDLMEQSDLLILLTNPEITAIKAGIQLKNIYQRLGLKDGKLVCLINKAASWSDIKVKEIANSLKIEIIGEIPFMPTEVLRLINAGRLALDLGPRRLAESFEKLAKQVGYKIALSKEGGSQ